LDRRRATQLRARLSRTSRRRGAARDDTVRKPHTTQIRLETKETLRGNTMSREDQILDALCKKLARAHPVNRIPTFMDVVETATWHVRDGLITADSALSALGYVADLIGISTSISSSVFAALEFQTFMKLPSDSAVNAR
jgi:hypothetical protein